MKNKKIAVVGAGGKTTLIHRLAEEYRRKGASVLVTTTTHMLVESDTDLSCDSFAIREKIKRTGYCMAGKSVSWAEAENRFFAGTCVS